MTQSLDELFLAVCTTERFIEEFEIYKSIKTDDWKDWEETPEIKMQMGADGVTCETFENDIQHLVQSTVDRIHKGKYLFYPVREVVKSKDPKIKRPELALKAGKARILSIASIRDVLVQKVLYDVIYPKAEQKFRRLPDVSFGYRRGKSAPLAARKIFEYVKQGYTAVLDADIKKFFDDIPHAPLFETIERFAQDSPHVTQLLKRFIKVDRIPWEQYRGNEWKFHKKKMKREKRDRGIPQGGILSGLVANLYLHSFDEWVMHTLQDEYDIKYVRYADDFVILSKRVSDLEVIKEKIRTKLLELELTLHSDLTKTKKIDLSCKGNYVNFVGFSISEVGIRVKPSNIERFKERVYRIIQRSNLNSERSLMQLTQKIKFKIEGNQVKPRICRTCLQPEAQRSWLNFFLTITDVQQLRTLDKWIKQQIHAKYYKETGTRLKRQILFKCELSSLEKLYYKYRKLAKNKVEFCSCKVLDKDFIKESELLVILSEYN